MTATFRERLRRRGLSPLARHASFFDRDDDGKVHLGETYAGLRSLGVGRALSSALAPIINLALGKRTGGGLTVIAVDGIVKGKHAFETGSFGAEGVIDEKAFTLLFENAAGGRPVITRDELVSYTRSNPDRVRPDVPPFLLRFFAWAEASVFFCVAGTKTADGTRVVPRARMHRFYEGRLLYAVERRTRLEQRLGKPITEALGRPR